MNVSGVDDLDEKQKQDIDDSIGILKFSGDEKLFAIDGQHRVEAIKRKYDHDNTYSDQISVIFVSHSDTTDGKKRTRGLFSDLNKTAQKVSLGELAIIDEQDIENIVARKLFAEYEPFSNGVISLSKSAPIKPNESKYFTNLLTLVKVSKIIAKIFFRVKKSKYSEEEIQLVFNEVVKFFDIVFGNIEELQCGLGESSIIQTLRIESKMSYMRPLGLEILADIYKKCHVMQLLNTLSNNLSTIDLSLDSLIFRDIVFINNKMTPKNKGITIQLLLFKLEVIDSEALTIDDHFLSDEILELIR